MKRLALVFLACASLAIWAGGCNNDESEPYFSRVRVSPNCGVAPLRVEGYAIASGGDETGDPTGTNNNLELVWDFGDGATAGNTLVYHTYSEPGTYSVKVTATDPDGKTVTYPSSEVGPLLVTVMPDSLLLTAMSDFPGGSVTTADTVHFDYIAEACGLDPDVPEDYFKLTQSWALADPDSVYYRGKTPARRFVTEGEHMIRLRVSYPGIAVTRFDTLYLQVTAP